MGEAFSAIFGIIWVIVIISLISSFVKKAKSVGQPQQRPAQQYQQPQPQRTANTQANNGKPTFRSVPGSTHGSSYTGNTPVKSSGPVYGTGAFAKSKTPGKISSSRIEASFGSRYTGTLGENAVLMEDRRNDWLAKQLREEAAIKKRGSVYDLGASHDVSCDADNLKKSHIKVHNTNGVNREMLR